MFYEFCGGPLSITSSFYYLLLDGTHYACCCRHWLMQPLTCCCNCPLTPATHHRLNYWKSVPVLPSVPSVSKNWCCSSVLPPPTRSCWRKPVSHCRNYPASSTQSSHCRVFDIPVWNRTATFWDAVVLFAYAFMQSDVSKADRPVT